MRRLLYFAVLLGALIIAAPASAQSIRECGNYGWTDEGDGPLWTYAPISGAGTVNVTSRVVGCATARRVVLRTRFPGSGNPRGPTGWRCRYVRQEYEFADIRCTASGGRVVRWQTGA